MEAKSLQGKQTMEPEDRETVEEMESRISYELTSEDGKIAEEMENIIAYELRSGDEPELARALNTVEDAYRELANETGIERDEFLYYSLHTLSRLQPRVKQDRLLGNLVECQAKKTVYLTGKTPEWVEVLLVERHK